MQDLILSKAQALIKYPRRPTAFMNEAKTGPSSFNS